MGRLQAVGRSGMAPAVQVREQEGPFRLRVNGEGVPGGSSLLTLSEVPWEMAPRHWSWDVQADRQPELLDSPLPSLLCTGLWLCKGGTCWLC